MSVHRNPRAYGGDFLLRNLWTASRGRKSNPEILTVLGSVCKENQSRASFPRFRFCISINDKKPRGHAPMKTAWGRLLICHCGKSSTDGYGIVKTEFLIPHTSVTVQPITVRYNSRKITEYLRKVLAIHL